MVKTTYQYPFVLQKQAEIMAYDANGYASETDTNWADIQRCRIEFGKGNIANGESGSQLEYDAIVYSDCFHNLALNSQIRIKRCPNDTIMLGRVINIQKSYFNTRIWMKA